MPDTDLGPLAQAALNIRRRVLRHPAEVSYCPSIWPSWWEEETALRAVAYLRDAGVNDDAVEAALLVVGCAHSDPETDDKITDLGGEVVMATRVLQGRPSDYSQSYWRELGESLPEHGLARAALQLALLDLAQAWPETDRRRRKVVGDAVHWVLPLLARADTTQSRQVVRLIAERLSMLRPGCHPWRPGT